MPRITVTIPDDLHRALRQAAARRSSSISELVVEALIANGLKSEEEALEIVRRARRRAKLSENEARTIAEKETRPGR